MRKIKIRCGATVAAWIFGYIPADIRADIEDKHPRLRLVGFKRGPAINLPDQDPRDRFVAIPELWGWGVLRDGPPKRRQPIRRPAWGTSLLLALLTSPLAAQEPEPPAEPVEVEAPARPPGIAGAGWCSVHGGGDEHGRCEMGLAGVLKGWRVDDQGHYAALVATLGSGGAEDGERKGSAGLGVAWYAKPGERFTFGVGGGVSCLFDDGGLDTGTCRATVGGAIGFSRGRR